MITAILAGGKSSRFGSDKLNMRIGNSTLLQQVIACAGMVSHEVIVVGRHGDQLDGITACIQDTVGFPGPIGGLSAALIYAGNRPLFVLAADLPLLTESGLTWYLNQCKPETITIAITNEGKSQVLHTLIPPVHQPGLLRMIQSGAIRSLDFLFRQFNPDYINVPLYLESHFRNMNSPEDVPAQLRHS